MVDWWFLGTNGCTDASHSAGDGRRSTRVYQTLARAPRGGETFRDPRETRSGEPSTALASSRPNRFLGCHGTLSERPSGFAVFHAALDGSDFIPVKRKTN
jgi:hypothetical protein